MRKRGSRLRSQKHPPARTDRPHPGGNDSLRPSADRPLPAEGVDVTTVRLATESEARHLGLSEVTAVAVVLHTAYDQEGQPLVCEEGVTPTPHYEQVETYAM